MNTFYYPISDFLENTKMLSMYRANSLINNGAEASSDDNILSTGDESILKKYLKAGASLVANILSGYTKDLQTVIDGESAVLKMVGEPFEFNSTTITFRINMPLEFNQSVVASIDEAIKDALENYLLYRTSKLRMMESESFKDDYETALNLLRNYISRRTIGIKRNYRFP